MLDIQFNADLAKARRLLIAGDPLNAQQILEHLHHRDRKNTTVLALLARAAVESAQFERALELLTTCVSLQPKSIEFQVELAATLIDAGRTRQAITRLERLVKAHPNDVALLARLADAQERAGEPDRARAVLEPILASGRATAHVATIWARTALLRKEPEDAFKALEPHATAPNAAQYPSAFWFTLGQVCERTNRLDAAFAAYQRGNQRTRPPFDPHAYLDLYRRIIKCITRTSLQRIPRPDLDTSRPIFIAGRPRSGTTLIEKILDAHPRVTGVGELAHLVPIIDNLGFEIGSMLSYPEAVRDLDRDDVTRISGGYLEHITRLVGPQQRSADKNLLNYQMLGMLQALFPQAHAVHIHRDAVDNCWAIFVADMNYAWCQDLYSLGFTHGLYERLMEHWRHTLDLPLLDVGYEALVDDQEGWTRRMLEFCGLAWAEESLRFYETSASAKDSVSSPTLSYSQVRQPIYKSSVGRAARFDAYLKPLRDGLEQGRAAGATL